MTDSERAALVRKIFDDILSGSADVLMGAVADDVVMRLTVQPGTPLSGEFVGPDGVRRYLASNDEVVDTSDLEVTDVFSAAGTVVVLGTEQLRIKRTGTVHPDSHWCMVFRFRDDRIAEMLVIEDTAPLSRAYPPA
jgi:ketosteroid isomerase-like protein